MNNYFIGGLENTDDEESININGTDYIFTNKFKSMLRDSILDWGTFLEIYNDSLDNENVLNHINKLFKLKKNNIDVNSLKIVKDLYNKPDEYHIVSMLNQFMMYEPVSISVRALFMNIKLHFEQVFEKFIILRNEYIKNNKLKVKINDWDKLTKKWNHENKTKDLNSSSVILLFMNPPQGIKSGIHYKIPGKEKLIDQLRDDIKVFNYPGFCPKVPYKRLYKLLNFPINGFSNLIKELDNNVILPNYKSIEKDISNILNSLPKPPKVKNKIKREKIPKKNNELELIKWYVTEILQLRKRLLPYGEKYEKYYIDSAKVIMKVNDNIKYNLVNY